MSDLIQLEMTLDEARETDRLIKRHINTTRYLLLDMRDRKGWKALGYESFKEYGEKELGYKEARIYQLVDAAEISLQLGYDSTTVESPPDRQLRPLKAVPEEERKAIWRQIAKFWQFETKYPLRPCRARGTPRIFRMCENFSHSPPPRTRNAPRLFRLKSPAVPPQSRCLPTSQPTKFKIIFVIRNNTYQPVMFLTPVR